MLHEPNASIVNLIRQAYGPFTRLSDLLHSFLQAAIEATDATQGQICLRNGPSPIGLQEGGGLIVDANTGGLIFERPCSAECTACAVFCEQERSDPVISLGQRSEVRCIRMRLAQGPTLLTPLRYQGTTLGVLQLAIRQNGSDTTAYPRLCQLIADEIAHHIKRYDLSASIKARLGRELICIGASEALRRIDRFIEKVSRIDLPVLIRGEFGTEKEYVAHALHVAGPRRDGPFDEVKPARLDPHTFESELADRFRRSDGGTVFFNGIDELDYKLQYRLSEIFEYGVGEWMRRSGRGEPVDVRIVASLGGDPEEMVKEGRLCQALLGELDFLRIRIAPLREHPQDIKPLAEHFLRKYGGQQPRAISEEVLEICQAYDWPRNVCELGHVIACLATMSEEAVISTTDVQAHAPKLIQAWRKQARPTDSPISWRENRLGERERKKASTHARLARLACNLIREEFSELEPIHPNLRKALEYLAVHFQESVSLKELARHACLSASHLSYLFQKTLGVSSKPFLAIMRIERAKQLLVERPHLRITEIAFEVGFGDLSHFERTFKRLVGSNPRDYRRMQLEQPSS